MIQWRLLAPCVQYTTASLLSFGFLHCRHQQELWQSRPELIAARAEAHQTPWHRREVVTHVCFLNTSALQARAVRSRDETGEAAGAHIVHPSPSKWSLLKGPTVRGSYHFMNISCNFHNSRQTYMSHVHPRSKIWICVIWMTFSGDRKKQWEFNGSCLCRAGTRPFRLFSFPWCFSFFPAGTRPGRSGAVQSLEFHLLTSINLQSFSKLKESQESVSVPFTTLRMLRI